MAVVKAAAEAEAAAEAAAAAAKEAAMQIAQSTCANHLERADGGFECAGHPGQPQMASRDTSRQGGWLGGRDKVSGGVEATWATRAGSLARNSGAGGERTEEVAAPIMNLRSAHPRLLVMELHSSEGEEEAALPCNMSADLTNEERKNRAAAEAKAEAAVFADMEAWWARQYRPPTLPAPPKKASSSKARAQSRNSEVAGMADLDARLMSGTPGCSLLAFHEKCETEGMQQQQQLVLLSDVAEQKVAAYSVVHAGTVDAVQPEESAQAIERSYRKRIQSEGCVSEDCPHGKTHLDCQECEDKGPKFKRCKITQPQLQTLTQHFGALSPSPLQLIRTCITSLPDAALCLLASQTRIRCRAW